MASRRSEILRAGSRRQKKAGGNFIQGVLSKPGAKGGLHRSLGVPQGQKIPVRQIEAHEHDAGKVGRQARFAMVLRGLGR